MHLSLMSLKLRRDIFRALVALQDSGETVVVSRDIIAKQFDLTRRQIRSIEDEGIDNEWPPLSQLIEEDSELSEIDDLDGAGRADEPVVLPAKPDSENHAA